MHNLKSKLYRLNKCKYSLYTALLGQYTFDNFILNVDDVQADPFASPSKVTIEVPFMSMSFDFDWIQATDLRKHSFCDTIGRIFARNLRQYTSDKGSGNSGFCGIRYGNQKILKSNAVTMGKESVFFKMLLGLPGFGRSIAGKEAQQLFLEEIPKVVSEICVKDSELIDTILKAAQTLEKQQEIRDKITRQGFVAFVANGSLLPRVSSSDDKPMSKNKVELFQSPKELEISLSLTDGNSIKGMAIPKGITLITGSGFHGKSTLIKALSDGIYNHILGDGREFCFIDKSAVFVRAEDGRSVEGTDISMFINNLPEGQSSDFFQTNNASGSTSQAANFVEALEIDTNLILMDEDISATNFLIRDEKMRSLIPDEKETITPLISRIQSIKQMGISLIMVTGALGEFLELADTVILSEDYQYYDVTKKVKDLFPKKKSTELEPIRFKNKRTADANMISYEGKRKRCVIDGGDGFVKLGKQNINLRYWAHICDSSQYASISAILAYAKDKGYFSFPLKEVWNKVEDDLRREGYSILESFAFENLPTDQKKQKESNDNIEKNPWRYIVETRPIEWHATLSRMQSLQCFDVS